MHGVVQHSGSLQGGHYIAYVKYTMGDCEHETAKHTKHRKEVSDGGESGYSNFVDNHVYQTVEDDGESGDRQEDIWCYTSDSYVTFANKTDVHDCQAYLLLYMQRR